MTVEPLVFRLGPLEISGFGLLMLTGFVAAAWTIRLELQRRRLDPAAALDIGVAAALGGILGAKLWYAALYRDPAALLARSGMVWYGGLILGALAVILYLRRRRAPIRFGMDLVAPALALGYGAGRIGCFLVGDDYGTPTDLPWAVKFPHGLPPSTAGNLSRLFGVEPPPGTRPDEVLAVHATQLYEAAAMLALFWILWRLRDHRRGAGWLFGLFLAGMGVERFLVELLRAKDDRFFGALTLAQLTSLAAVVLGLALMGRWRRRDAAVLEAGARALAPRA